MQNTKAKKVLLFIVITLIIISIVLVTYFYISKNEKTVLGSENNVTGETSKIKEEELVVSNADSSIKEQESTKREIQYVYIIEDAINKYVENAGTNESGEKLYLKVRVPKINIDSEQVKKINNEIYNKYNSVNVTTNKGGADVDITYTYKYMPEKSLIFIKITEKYHAHTASGSINYNTYVYNIKEDKFLTMSELLNLYNISQTEQNQAAKLQLEIKYGQLEKEGFESYKSNLAEIEKDKSYSIYDLENDYIILNYPTDPEGMKVEIGK